MSEDHEWYAKYRREVEARKINRDWPPDTSGHDPIFHAAWADCLPASHPRAYESFDCVKCGTGLHAFNNENMSPWFETGKGAVCWNCMGEIMRNDAPDFEDYALTGKAPQ